jgi:hypothetical protein
VIRLDYFLLHLAEQGDEHLLVVAARADERILLGELGQWAAPRSAAVQLQ